MTTKLSPIKTGPEGQFTPPADGWIHISPFGRYPVTLVDGTPSEIVIDQASVAAQVSAFDAEAAAAGSAWGGLLVDFDHSSLDEDRSTEAAGWADALAARADGLWARIRWTDSGLSAITGGRFRYSSPVHLPSQCDRIASSLRPRRLHRLALTNDPRMLRGDSRMRPISSRSSTGDRQVAPNPNQTPEGTAMDYKVLLLQLLGLPAEADDAAIQAAIDASAKADTDAAAEAEAMKSRLATAEAALSANRADVTIAQFEREGMAIASRDDIRKALIADHDGTLRAIRALRPAAAAGSEPLRSRASATAPAATATGANDAAREEAIAAAAKTYNLKSRADAVARAQLSRPDLWK
jgi:phage I-like protein